jgi:hypothetical protein
VLEVLLSFATSVLIEAAYAKNFNPTSGFILTLTFSVV